MKKLFVSSLFILGVCSISNAENFSNNGNVLNIASEDDGCITTHVKHFDQRGNLVGFGSKTECS